LSSGDLSIYLNNDYNSISIFIIIGRVEMKTTVIAHPIQGLIKYHGLRDRRLRLPFHDSISVCAEALNTTTTIEKVEGLERNLLKINGRDVSGFERERVDRVLNEIKKLSSYSGFFKVVSENNVVKGKGLGFSASGFAALGLAACRSLELKIDQVSLSEIVRLGAGSATRSLAGSFAIWFANKNDRSYAERLVEADSVDLVMVIIPISSEFKTDEAHVEVLSSPLFQARLNLISDMIESMKKYIEIGDISGIGRLSEEDTLNLHAITMTGKSHIVLWEPETIRIIREVVKMRDEGISAWYSMDTGPSVFINTCKDCVEKVVEKLNEINITKYIVSKVGDAPTITQNHLF
jgi:phosphomevalonate decarboxylase